MSQYALRELMCHCDWRTDAGVTPDGRKVRRSYRINGNWDIYVNDVYVGTAYVS